MVPGVELVLDTDGEHNVQFSPPEEGCEVGAVGVFRALNGEVLQSWTSTTGNPWTSGGSTAASGRTKVASGWELKSKLLGCWSYTAPELAHVSACVPKAKINNGSLCCG